MDQLLKEKIPRPGGGQAVNPRILVAPLDWGLGHATRCIPLVRELISQGCAIWLAGEGGQKALLQTEFPDLPFLDLPGYRIHYSKTKKGLLWKMIQQAPKMRRAILYEHQWLKRIVKEYHIDAVISDNRYGLYHTDIPCIFITHQLLIKSSAGKWTEKFLQHRNYRYIDRFTACWVPDMEGENNLAADLSHPVKKPSIPLYYIGPLSRFQQKEAEIKKGHLLFILSGPEPQRSILEEKIIKEIAHYNGTATIVRGLPGSASLIPSSNMIRIYNHLPADDLNKEMASAEYVISRSGYSTVMDLAVLKKKSILIPTPGQTEQEWLGKYLMKKGIALSLSQKDLSINSALEKANKFNYHLPVLADSQLMKKAVQDLLSNF